MQPSSERVVELLADAGLNATPNSVEAILRHDDPSALVERLARDCDAPVVTREHVTEYAEVVVETDDKTTSPPPDRPASTDPSVSNGSSSSSQSPEQKESSTPSDPPENSANGGSGTVEKASTSGTPTQSEGTPSPTSTTQSTRSPTDYEVSGDITGESRTEGEYSDFVGYFRDRFERLSGNLRSRLNPRSIESAASGGKEVSLIGMVNEVRSTSSDNRIVEIEDPTGEMRVLLSEDDVELAETLVADEVIGVEGRLSDDGGIVFADEIHHPDIPPRREPNTADREVSAVLVSDVHVGSQEFVGDRWSAFADWLHDCPDVEYVLVAGDLVEGVGIYPGQEDELEVVDLYEQYAECARRFDELPDDVEIITITGNHDSVRLAEPQPALSEPFREPFPDNVSFYGNPSTVTVEGVDFLMYHGMSLNPFAETVPHIQIESPETAMVEMLRKRHLAPMYGDVRLAPERTDRLVIDDVPDVLHTGHTHTVGAERYRNVVTVNTGAWQSQTPYQEKMNIQPDVGYAGLLNLSSLELDLKQFA